MAAIHLQHPALARLCVESDDTRNGLTETERRLEEREDGNDLLFLLDVVGCCKDQRDLSDSPLAVAEWDVRRTFLACAKEIVHQILSVPLILRIQTGQPLHPPRSLHFPLCSGRQVGAVDVDLRQRLSESRRAERLTSGVLVLFFAVHNGRVRRREGQFPRWEC
jgi:hypothetical protein